jgi:hypothetical protein
MDLGYRIVIEEIDNRKYIDIYIVDSENSNEDLAKMTVYLLMKKRKQRKDLPQINISNIEKYSEHFKNCLREFMKILVYSNAEIFGKPLSEQSEVVLFVEPQPPAWKTEEIKYLDMEDDREAYQKLNAAYVKSGLKNYDPENPKYMVSYLSKLRKVIEGTKYIDDPYRTPNESYEYGSPTRPNKDKPLIDVPIIVPKQINFTRSHRYRQHTVSSQAKRKSKKGGKRSNSKRSRKQRK